MAQSNKSGSWQRTTSPVESVNWVTKRLTPIPRIKKTRQQLAAQSAFTRANTPLVTSAKAAKRAAVAEMTWPGEVPGYNDRYPTCSALAVASHLRAADGVALTDDEIWRLHYLAGGTTDSGVSIEAVLEAAKSCWHPSSAGQQEVRLRSFCQVDEGFLLSGLVVGISLPHDGHAVLTQPGGMVSWGRLMPLDGEPEEAWALEWEVLTAKWSAVAVRGDRPALCE